MGNASTHEAQTDLSAEAVREIVASHLARQIGDPQIAFSDQDGWNKTGAESGPPVDILVCPPQGERLFAYVSTFGCSLSPLPAPAYRESGRRKRVEFVLAAQQIGSREERSARLNEAGNLIRQFAKLVHAQPVTIEPGETIAFDETPKPIFAGSELVAFTFMSPRLLDGGSDGLKLSHSDSVTFVAPVLITRDELELARREGPKSLHERLYAAGVTEMVDLTRKSVALAPLVLPNLSPKPRKRGWMARVGDFFGRKR